MDFKAGELASIHEYVAASVQTSRAGISIFFWHRSKVRKRTERRPFLPKEDRTGSDNGARRDS